MTSRDASHAGSWYSDNPGKLSRELDGWLAAVPQQVKYIGSASSSAPPVDIPVPGARAIIAPHAGYAYSGPAAAWAYKAVDWSKAKRIFLLGPSHHFYSTDCSLSQCKTYETPLGDLQLDLDTIAELRKTGRFSIMKQDDDEAEHSLEMHLPYIYKMLSRSFPDPSKFPPLTPILVGSTAPSTEKIYGKLLAPYLADPTSIFVVSSDFCHWGSRFRYTYYQPEGKTAAYHIESSRGSRNSHASRFDTPTIHESIKTIDQQAMDSIETGKHDEFLQELDRTGNTVCGRHPIGVVMAAIEEMNVEDQSSFKFVKYDRSSLVHDPSDSSVSYCSAFAEF